MTREELVAHAGKLVPILRERAAKAESLRRMPDETVADLVAAGLTRTAQPKRFGGSELGWDAICEAAMTLGKGDASQAWVANVYAEHAFMVALFPDRAQREVWDAHPEALISASISPVGNRVARADGGFVLDGIWPFVSGVYHSDWTLIGDLVREADRPPEHCLWLVPRADREMIDDWHVSGMAGTGSNSVKLDNVFVPAHRALRMTDATDSATPGAEVNRDPLYRMPIYGFTNLALASVPVGVAEAMVDELARDVARRAARTPPPIALEALHTRIAESAAEVKAAKLLVMDAASTNVRKLATGERLLAADNLRTAHQGTYACLLARRAAARLFEAAGGHGIYLSNVMQRAFRDVYASTAHAGLNWDRAALRYGEMTVADRSARSSGN
jgi:3-hydroxy-9,10-secoandrosta-1,3,5(10)-triene-9,17-dione monooxygenase